jgi:hypothetical protein
MNTPEPVSNVRILDFDIDDGVSHVTVSEDADVPGFVNYEPGDTIPFLDIHYRNGEWKISAEAGNAFGKERSLISVSDISEWHYEMSFAQKKINEVNEML